jgi:hypothetical protein
MYDEFVQAIYKKLEEVWAMASDKD